MELAERSSSSGRRRFGPMYLCTSRNTGSDPGNHWKQRRWSAGNWSDAMAMDLGPWTGPGSSSVLSPSKIPLV
ncbi:hypothetical protein ColTof4_03423 [Colletotrichum tofieldiae]|uniref:Uncharacterized protein n=1 Tax=Colletotrichum liriopes TaxID=708192 RepID=A0AA37LR42_9PEZI|nr:hypothetical protein ColLi_04059 [Colletotrichum liriopes]GKT65819.1 hypothetical protein ColTof3_13158 [Colletotrichum tofieldiae]GKT71000.1 hypothetical protein ColTof4_03423 [Colletotrichum tofieldiae]